MFKQQYYSECHLMASACDRLKLYFHTTLFADAVTVLSSHSGCHAGKRALHFLTAWFSGVVFSPVVSLGSTPIYQPLDNSNKS